jgi:xanthine phosphoribosyltransferase
MEHDYRKARALNLGWQEMHADSRALAGKIAALEPFDGIVAVARGGLIPAAILAQELNLKLVETVCISSYADRSQGEMQILKTLPEAGKRWLAVDDLVDSGATARVVRAMLPNACYAALYAKPEGRDSADVFLRELAQDVWLVFPWENGR